MVEQEPDMVFLSYPAQYDQRWWCGCGYAEIGGRVFEKTGDDLVREKWEWANGTKGAM
jgi:hypothetical protein